MSVRVLLVTLIVLFAANLGIEISNTVPDAGRIGMAGRWRTYGCWTSTASACTG